MLENESWVLFDKNFKPLNKIVPRYTELTKDEYSLGVHIWVKCNGKYLIFKRSATKRTFPNFYEMIGGGINGNEDPMLAALRELKEESGIDAQADELKFLFMSRVDYGNGIIYPEHTYVYMIEKNNLSVSDIKIEEGKNCSPAFLSKEEIIKLMDKKIFVPVVTYREIIEKEF